MSIANNPSVRPVSTESDVSALSLLAALAAQKGVKLWHLRPDVALPSRRSDRADRADGIEAAEPRLLPPNAVRVSGGYGYAVNDAGIATLDLLGPLMRTDDVLWYDEGTSSDYVRADVAAIAADPNVRGVMLRINSPGGTVDGAYELADALHTLAAVKPVAAYGEGVVASAAYLMASQASAGISATRTNITGSIGTRTAVVDAHSMFERMGVKMIPIDSGGMKSAGLFGTEITADQMAYFQGLIDNAQTHFVDAVRRGRGVSAAQANAWADGRVHPAAAAKALGLIDHIETFEQAMARLTAKAGGPAQRNNPPAAGRSAASASPLAAADPVAEREATMPSQNTESAAANPAAVAEPKAATVSELKAALAGASSDFVLEQAEKGATLAQAKDAFIGWQSAQIRSRDEDLARAAAATATAAADAKAGEPKIADAKPATKTGVAPMTSAAGEQSAGGGGDAIAEFERRVATKMTATGKSRELAAQEVLASDDAFRADYVAAVQAERRRATR